MIFESNEKIRLNDIGKNNKLKNEIRKLRNILEAQESSNSRSNNVNNIDLLRRISQLEKIVYGKNE